MSAAAKDSLDHFMTAVADALALPIRAGMDARTEVRRRSFSAPDAFPYDNKIIHQDCRAELRQRQTYDPARAAALDDYFTYARDNDLYLSYVIINPQADNLFAGADGLLAT